MLFSDIVFFAVLVSTIALYTINIVVYTLCNNSSINIRIYYGNWHLHTHLQLPYRKWIIHRWRVRFMHRLDWYKPRNIEHHNTHQVWLRVRGPLLYWEMGKPATAVQRTIKAVARPVEHRRGTPRGIIPRNNIKSRPFVPTFFLFALFELLTGNEHGRMA